MVRPQRLNRFEELVDRADVDAAVVTSPENITYYLGYSRFGGGRSVLVTNGSRTHCLMPEGEDGFVGDVPADIDTYPGYRIDSDADPLLELSDRINELVAGHVGVEAGDTHATGVATASIPVKLLDALEVDGTVDITPDILAQRAVKDEADMGRMRTALNVTETGITTVEEAVEPGVSEVELLGEATAAMERASGGHVDVFCDLVSGEKTAGIGCPGVVPGERELEDGDLVIVEMIPTVAGYTGSTARTFVVGEPSDRQNDLYSTVVETLESTIDVIEPGMEAATVYAHLKDQLTERGFGEKFPHHAGHGLGIDVHEPPLIIPGSDAELESGNVLAIEPGIYDEEWGGIRVEDVVHVTDDGAERLTSLQYGL